MRNTTSKSGNGYARANVSMPAPLRQIAGQVCHTKGYAGLSSYLQHYLRRDAAALGITPLIAMNLTAMSPLRTVPDLTSGLAG